MEEKYTQKIGKYDIIRLIGKGGMGEIFLAKDPVCEREVALKQILRKLIHYPTIRKRFLSEAKIAAQLAHPSIIPIYSLHIDENQIYYTMPYVEGETLKQILKTTREKEKAGDAPHPIGSSIPSLIRLFLNVCQAIHYTHTKGFLHRDLKPENIIVGQFGEVMILDWGIALPIGIEEEEITSIEATLPHELTKPGKVVGTVGYMAPERAIGQSATIQTDIYSLGIILYQILTLRLPFIRPSLRDFRKQMKHEQWIEPQEVAPYRDIPTQLSHIAKKSLSPNPTKRYQSVHEMIEQLESYIEGCPEWIPAATLELDRSEDWEFQENIVLAKHIAISRISNIMEWVMLMISKELYSGNMKIETTLQIKQECQGVGFLLCIPEPSDRKGLEDGYCLWIGTQQKPSCTLFRSNVEVMHIPEIALKPGCSHTISIEKFENNVRLFIDGILILSYVSHIPLVGGHLGMLLRDTHFKCEKLNILFGSQNVMVNCLSIPDAFLTSKDYGKALSEYRRIAHSFKGRAEGREALFRAGITILEQAKNKTVEKKKQEFFSRALDEFEKLHSTPGAPLEYLGKSLVYRAEEELEEEIKCLELAIRKYPKHPLLPVVEEHIGFRLHETSRFNRLGAYSFLLLAIRHVSHVLHSKETQTLIKHLTADWEPLSFIETPKHFSSDSAYNNHLATQLAFWLCKPTTLYEILQKIQKDTPERYLLIGNALFALLEMGHAKLAQYILQKHLQESTPEFLLLKNYTEIAIQAEEKPVKDCLDLFFRVAPNHLAKREARILKFLFEKGLTIKEAPTLLPFFEKLTHFEIEIDLKPLEIWALLLTHQTAQAKTLLPKSPISFTSPYYPLYHCILTKQEGEKETLETLKPLLDVKYPPSSTLLSHFLKGTITLKSKWIQNAFHWEKLQLFNQLILYYFCLGKKRKVIQFEHMIVKEREKSQIPLNFM